MTVKARLPLPDVATLKSRLSYNPKTGDLTWLVRDLNEFESEHRARSWNRAWAGRVAGYRKKALASKQGHSEHIQVTIDGKRYYAHRIIWAMVYGKCDAEDVDHENGVQYDNRLVNLVPGTHGKNTKNAKLNSRNKSGFSGITQKKNRWRASIGSRHKNGVDTFRYIGSFETKEAAIAARKSAEIDMGYHPNHGRDA